MPLDIAKRAKIGDVAHAEIPPPRQRGWQDAPGLARTEVKKAMTGTAFETLLEPISQPALKHEIVVGLIKAERTMRSHHWNKRARHIPKSKFPVAPVASPSMESNSTAQDLRAWSTPNQRLHFKEDAKSLVARTTAKKSGERVGFERAVGARMLLGDEVPVTRSAISIVACIRASSRGATTEPLTKSLPRARALCRDGAVNATARVEFREAAPLRQ